jgi:Na+/H+-dicarboxylate symporter
MSLPRQILPGLVPDVVTGVFFRERGFRQEGADIYVKLLRMTVLPYVTVSLISRLGCLDAAQAKALGLKIYKRWILGRTEGEKTPRWSVMRDVLQWGR